MNPLEGKTVLITGGTAGIGRACAEAMLAAGAEAVVINGRSRERGERALAAIGRFLGRIDILVNSTGTNDFPALLHNIATEDVPGIIQRCLLAQLLSCRAVLPHMRKANAGCIINIASDAAKIPTPAKA
jgi:2-hydroxycyclohexanecarboxyl-CoA dehydrogenase